MKKFNLVYLSFLIVVFISACNNKTLSKAMYGIPVHNTGLSKENCNTLCKDSSIISKNFSSKEYDALINYKNSIDIELLTENPYKVEINKSTTGVCAVVIEDREAKIYHLETFESVEAAENARAIVTHVDACGACSTLQDLAVYAENLDLGASVRKLALKNFSKPFDSLQVALESLGFTKPCAQIWAFNTRNTQKKCFAVCITNNRYNKKNGDLSKCLQCDETKSGPVFKAIAGRTRRNTGIVNAICRFCDEVKEVKHNYNF